MSTNLLVIQTINCLKTFQRINNKLPKLGPEFG